MAEKITAPAGAIVNGPDTVENPHDLWWVAGELYVDLDAQPQAAPIVTRYANRPGYTVETGQTIPQAYLDTVAAYREQARQHFGSRPRVALQDATDPNRANYVTPPAG